MPTTKAQDADRHVGARIRERRVMLGMTQQQAAELLDLSYQQLHKYEKGMNRVAAGKLWQISQALGVGINYFFEGIGNADASVPSITQQQRMLLGLAHNFLECDLRGQVAIAQLARQMAQDGW